MKFPDLQRELYPEFKLIFHKNLCCKEKKIVLYLNSSYCKDIYRCFSFRVIGLSFMRLPTVGEYNGG